MTALLTIAIPTYNRNTRVKTTIQRLLPQFTDGCELLVIDNCSSIPVSETLRHALPEEMRARWRLVRNEVNIGGNANIVRCFEMCNTKWMWLLADDDCVDTNAIASITGDIENSPNTTCFNYRSHLGRRSQSFTTVDIEDFVRRVDFVHNFIFMSANVYNLQLLRHQCQYGLHHAYSCAPHLAMLLRSLAVGGTCVFSDRSIVEWCPAEEAAQRYSAIPVFLGFPLICESIRDSGLSQMLARKIMSGFWLRKVATALLHECVEDPGERRRLFRIAESRYRIATGRIGWGIGLFCRFAVECPQIALAMDRFFRWVLARRPYPPRNSSPSAQDYQ